MYQLAALPRRMVIGTLAYWHITTLAYYHIIFVILNFLPIFAVHWFATSSYSEECD